MLRVFKTLCAFVNNPSETIQAKDVMLLSAAKEIKVEVTKTFCSVGQKKQNSLNLVYMVTHLLN